MAEKISRIIVEDPHGNTVDREISTSEREIVMAEHNADATAHEPIRNALNQTIVQSAQDLTAALSNHNVASDAHSDIRDLANSKVADVQVGETSVVENGVAHIDPEDFGKVDDVQVDGQSVVTGKVANIDSSNFGKVDDVQVDGQSVVSNKVADFHIPTSVSELSDSDDYATKEYVADNTPTTVAELSDADDYATKVEAQAMVDEAKVIGATVDYQEDDGSPDATVKLNNGSLDFTLKNMKMKFSDLEPEEVEQLRGPQGVPGQSIIEGEGDLPLENYVSEADNKAVTPKAVYDELMIDRTWSESVISSQNSGASDRRYISSDVWKSESTTTQGAIFPVTVGKTYKLIAASGNIYYAFVTAKSTANNDPVSYAGEATGLSSLSNGASVSVVAPSDAVFLYTSRKSSSTVVLPTVKEIETTKEHIASIDASVEELEDSVEELVGENLPTRVETLEESIQGIDEEYLL